MRKLLEIYHELKKLSDWRYDNFVIETIHSISRISEKAYLEKPIWLGGEEQFTCLFVDLNNSTRISQVKSISTVAKIYDYFTQNIYDILTLPPFAANYIDIKGDGVLGIYEGENDVFKAFVAAVTFKTFFEKYIKKKFVDKNIVLSCKISLNKERVLVKKIGSRGAFNEVWAGELVNNAFKIASLSENIIKQDADIQKSQKNDLLIVSREIYEKLKEKEDYAILSCGHTTDGQILAHKRSLWKEYSDSVEDSEYNNSVYYLSAIWCDICGDSFLSKILQ